MTAAEFCELRSEAPRLTAATLAERLQIDEQDIYRYEIGLIPIPPLVEYAVLWIIRCDQSEAFLSGN